MGQLIFHPYPGKAATYELGFIIGRAYQRQGYGYEAAQAAISYGFVEAQLTAIIATADAGNGASIALLQKLGMAPTVTAATEANLVTYQIKRSR